MYCAHTTPEQLQSVNDSESDAITAMRIDWFSFGGNQ